MLGQEIQHEVFEGGRIPGQLVEKGSIETNFEGVDPGVLDADGRAVAGAVERHDRIASQVKENEAVQLFAEGSDGIGRHGPIAGVAPKGAGPYSKWIRPSFSEMMSVWSTTEAAATPIVMLMASLISSLVAP